MADVAELAALANTGDMVACQELYRLAGAGSIEAQRAVLDGVLGQAGPLNSDWREVITLALVLCRLVAANGNRDDKERLASVLMSIAVERRREGDAFGADCAAFEGLGVIRDLADNGDSMALNWLANAAPHWPEAASTLERPVPPAPDLPVSGHGWPWNMACDVTEVPPIITTWAPLSPPTWRERVAMRWHSFTWAVRFWWWGVVDRFKARGF